MKKPPPRPELPESLADLPRYGLTSKRSSSRTQNERTDIAFGVRSLGDLADRISRGFADPQRSKTPARRPPTKRS